MILDLTTDRGYLIAAAMRGPDHTYTSSNTDVHLKSITTAVIRSLAGVTYVGASVHKPESGKALWYAFLRELQQSVRAMWWEQYHFRGHILRALEALQTQEATDYAIWLNAVMMNTRTLPSSDTPCPTASSDATSKAVKPTVKSSARSATKPKRKRAVNGGSRTGKRKP